MIRRRRGPACARVVLIATSLALSAWLPVGAIAQELQRPTVEPVDPGLPVDVADAVVGRPGTTIRSEGDLTVESVRVPARLRVGDVPARVYRVTIEGRYPPRALPYVMTVDGAALVTATPAPDLRSVVALTADRSVVWGRVGLTYGARPAEEGSAATARPSPIPRIRQLPSPGPFDVRRRVYDLGDRAFRPTGLGGAKVEVKASVHFPAGLPGGPFPIVLFMHGNHSTCFRGDRAGYRWPCARGWKPLPNHEGYDYAGSRLASYGYIVVSVSANGVNVHGNRVEDTGMRQRGELLEHHLDLWQQWSTVGGAPFGDRFVGKVDMSRIGTMGHSRGGEGAVWQVIVDRQRADPFGIDAVLALAPVDFTRETVNRVPLAIVLPYCDGDVFDLQGVHFFDDARYRVPGDPRPKHVLTVFGANHNFFNSVWTPGSGFPGAFDDSFGPCADKLRPSPQRRVGAAYIVSYFRRYLGGEIDLDPVWTGASTPRRIPPSRALMTYLAPDLPDSRYDIDRFTRLRSIRRTEAGDAVTATGLSLLSWCENTIEVPCIPGDLSFSDIHLPGLSRGVFGWTDPGGEVRFELGTGIDVRAFDALQFRATVNPGYRANSGIRRQDLTVSLVDGDGAEAAVPASAVSDQALRYPRGVRRFTGHVILQQLRFPLTGFEGIDLSDVREVVVSFDRVDAGVIDVADLAFSAGA